MKKRVYSKKISIFLTLSFIFICLTLLGTLMINSSINQVISVRDTRLDLYEQTKIWVMDDVRSYLTLDEKTYTTTKDSMHTTEEYKTKLFGSNFLRSHFPSADSVSFFDVQYTTDSVNDITYYLSCDVRTGDIVKRIQLLVFVGNNMIYNILAY